MFQKSVLVAVTSSKKHESSKHDAIPYLSSHSRDEDKLVGEKLLQEFEICEHILYEARDR